MKIKHQFVAALALVVVGSTAQAQITKDTYDCQKTIAKESAKFAKQIQKNIEKCFDAVSKCNLAADPNPCVANLLVSNQGRCAVGKLADDENYFGAGAMPNPASTSKIGKAFAKFWDGVQKKCDASNPSIDWGYIGLSAPASHQALIDDLNDDHSSLFDGDPVGIACAGHLVLSEMFPNWFELIEVLGLHPDGENLPLSLIESFVFGTGSCRG